jgi:flagellar motor switch/type III secretory pathway protein FliN
MTRRADEWLPAGALDCAPVRAAIADAVAIWSRKWFAGAKLEAASFATHRDGAPPRPSDWQRPGAAVAIAASPAGTLRLAGLALGGELGRLVLSEADRDIIAGLTAAAVADLARGIEGALGIRTSEGSTAASPTAEAVLSLSVAEGRGGALLEVAISLAALVQFRKAGLDGKGGKRPPLAHLSPALGASPVRIEVRLGRSTLPLGDLAALAPGDVLILDRSPQDGAELALAPSGASFAAAAIDTQAASLSLTLSPQMQRS